MTTIVHNQLQVELIDRLREGMSKRAWSQSELSRRSGVPQGNISRLMRRGSQGTLVTWNKLLRALEAE